jgi:hypothetical protein
MIEIIIGPFSMAVSSRGWQGIKAVLVLWVSPGGCGECHFREKHAVCPKIGLFFSDKSVKGLVEQAVFS